jgi:hypothetical protein
MRTERQKTPARSVVGGESGCAIELAWAVARHHAMLLVRKARDIRRLRAGSRPWSVTCTRMALLAKRPDERRSPVSLAVVSRTAASPERCFVTMERERRADRDQRVPIELTLAASVRSGESRIALIGTGPWPQTGDLCGAFTSRGFRCRKLGVTEREHT